MLNCLVLLTLVYLSTLVDLVSFLIFGFINVIHFKRRLYYQALKDTHQKWKPTVRHFGFVTAHTLQLLIEVLSFPICWK